MREGLLPLDKLGAGRGRIESPAVMNRLFCAFLIAAALAWGCGGSGNNAPTAPTPAPTGAPATTTETFTGTVAVGGYDMHIFQLAVAPGNVSITLTAVSPNGAQIEGLGLGEPVGGICQLDLGAGSYSNSTTAGTSPQIAGTLVSAGPWCVVVYYVSQQIEPITYTVTVFHS